MDQADTATYRIDQEHRATVSSIYPQAHPRVRRNQPIRTIIKSSGIIACDCHLRAVDLRPGAKQAAAHPGFKTKPVVEGFKPRQSLPPFRHDIHTGLADRKPVDRP